MNRFIRFHHVGHGKFSGEKKLHPEITTPNEIAEAAHDEVRKHLASNDIECEYDAETNMGKVFAGGRNVGLFTVLED